MTNNQSNNRQKSVLIPIPIPIPKRSRGPGSGPGSGSGHGDALIESRYRSPQPQEILALRLDLGLTQADCADMICYSTRAWQFFEAGDRRMHPSAWELFRLKTLNLNLKRKHPRQ